MGKYYSKIVGKGKPLIFLPAAGFNGLEGLNIAERLSDSYECHLLDLPGMGASEGIKGRISLNEISDWLKRYVDENQMERVTLIGHSMGAGIAMCFASLYPNFVSKVILLDQGHKKMPTFPTRDFGPFGYVIPIISGMERMFGDVFIKRIEKLFIGSSESQEKTNDDIEERLKEFCKRFSLDESEYIKKALSEDVNFTREGLRLMFGYYRLNLPNILTNITSPILLIYSSYQSYDPKEAANTTIAISNLKPQSNLQLYKMDSHHYVHWADDKCLLKIREFLKETKIV